jgi:hypothetical protein
MVTNIVWNLFVSSGGEAVFIGLAGSLIGLLLRHEAWLSMGGRRVAEPSVNEASGKIGNAPRRVPLEG